MVNSHEQIFNGAQFGGGCYCNHIDIAPDFAGILMGLSNTAGAVMGVFAPLVVGVVVKQVHIPNFHNGLNQISSTKF